MLFAQLSVRSVVKQLCNFTHKLGHEDTGYIYDPGTDYFARTNIQYIDRVGQHHEPLGVSPH